MSNCSGRKRRGIGRGLMLVAVWTLALAASPAAIANDRGGPGAPSVYPSITHPAFGLVPMLPGRFVSWTD